MTARVPENNKKPGVCYAVTDDGTELPVIDITHPAFACDVSQEELSAKIEETSRALAMMSAGAMRSLPGDSMLMRGWMQAAGGIMSGMMTYLNRLGPDNLGEGYAGAIDRRVAAGLAPLSFRFRLRDVARLIADGLGPALVARTGRRVHLLNIGGGPCADSLNALILIRKEHPEWLRSRQISIHVLDLDKEGPDFGARALAALLPEGAPLGGLAATLDHIEYDWAAPSGLEKVMDRIEADSVAAGSSEGGLFDYGSDDEIIANLRTLRDGTPDDFLMVGSVVRDESTLDPRLKMAPHAAGRPLIRFLGLDAFRTLAGSAGWAIDRVIESTMHHAVSLRKV